MIKIKKDMLLITPKMIKPSSNKLKVVGTINPAAVRRSDGKIVLYVRVVEKLKIFRDSKYVYSPRMDGEKKYKLKIDKFRINEVNEISDVEFLFKDHTKRLIYLSHLRKVVLDNTGMEILSIDKKPSFFGTIHEGELGIEDARITKIGDRYIMTYVTLSRKENISTALAISKDLEHWERKGIIFGEQDKDVVIFPEKINNQYIVFDRPEGNFEFSPPHIWVAYSKDLLLWGKLKSVNLIKKKDKHYFRVGSGPPPIKTKKGWLLIYHVVSQDGNIYVYSGSAALLNLKNPRRVIAKADELIVPLQNYEMKLYENKRIVFPTGIVLDKNKEDLLIYSGGGDVVASVKKISLKEIFHSLKRIK